MKPVFSIFAVLLVILVVLYQQGVFKGGPAIHGILPDHAQPGETVAIQGTGFGSDIARTVVFFNNQSTVPESVNETSITVSVPGGAVSGLVHLVIGDSRSNERFFKVDGGGMPPGHGRMSGKIPGMPKGSSPPSQQAPPGGEEAGMGSPASGGMAHEFYDADNAKDFIDFELPNEKGERVRLSAYKGKVIALNFWATWCKPCLEEVPSLERLTRRSGTMDLVVLAVSVDKSFADIRKALPDTNLNILHDPTSEIARKYGTLKFPETWIIDKDGKVVARFIGSRNWDSPTFEAFFSMLLKGQKIPTGMGR